MSSRYRSQNGVGARLPAPFKSGDQHQRSGSNSVMCSLNQKSGTIGGLGAGGSGPTRHSSANAHLIEKERLYLA